MGSGEPALVPEWYRAGKGGKNPNANSDDNGVGLSSRNRLPLIPCDWDSRKSSGRNGSVRSDKSTSVGAQAYSNFGRRDRKKNPNLRDRDRDRPLLADIGPRDYHDSVAASRTNRDRLWHNYSGALGRRKELRPKTLESDSKSVGLPRDNVNSGGIRRASSFKKEFPTLASGEKKGALDTGRVSTAIESLPLPSPTTIGGDSWTSALAEIPAVVGGNVLLSSAVQTAPVSPVSLARKNTTGLNMAEALFQASSRVRTPPQLSSDTSRADELVFRQCKQLIPMTPSMPKITGFNSSEKSRFRATKAGDFGGPPKSGQQLSSQLLVNNALCVASARSDVPKASQIGNYQILCRERTGVISPASKDASSQDDNLKSPINPNLKAENKSANMSLISSSKLSLGSFGEKRPVSLAQNRNDFFNSIRKKTSVIPSSGAVASPESSCCVMEKSLSSELNAGSCADISMSNQEENHGDGYCSHASVINPEENSGDSGLGCGDGAGAYCVETQLDRRFQSESPEDDVENKQSLCCLDSSCHEAVELNEQDKAFLQSLGWKEEDAKVEALTAEEISSFIKQYQKKLRPYSKLWNRFKADFLDHFEAASLSVVQTSSDHFDAASLSVVQTSSDCLKAASLSVVQTS